MERILESFDLECEGRRELLRDGFELFEDLQDFWGEYKDEGISVCSK